MHSRHTYANDDGCNITQEQNGMRVILELYQSRRAASTATAAASGMSDKVPCQVTLLSDRACTINGMNEWLAREHSILGCHETLLKLLI